MSVLERIAANRDAKHAAGADGLTAVKHLHSMPALSRGQKVQIGDRIWCDETSAIHCAVMGGWIEEGKMAQGVNGKEFCLTGKMWTGRAEIGDEIRKFGGKVVSSAKRDGVILVVGDGASSTSPSHKELQAKRAGNDVITHVQLKSVLAGAISLNDAILGRMKPTTPQKKRQPAEPIDRAKHAALVKQVAEDLGAISFGK